MRYSRRGFVTLLLLAAAGGAAGAARSIGPFRTAYRWVKNPTLPPMPPGPLGERDLRTLLAATEALAGYPIDHDRYADFFRWHAATLSGYKALYERFTMAVNRSARLRHGCGYVECSAAARLAFLDRAFRVRPQDLPGKVRVRIFDRDWVLFDRHIVRAVVALFARTDAWRLAGYEAWPGMPRGLERYRRPP